MADRQRVARGAGAARGTASEVERLRRRLERERRARREAESIAERTTRELYVEVADRTRELESLVTMGRELAKALESHGFADLIARHIAQAVGFDECGIYAWERAERAVVTVGYFPTERRALLDDRYSLDDYPETRRVLETGQPSVIDPTDPLADPNEVRFLTDLGGTLMFQLPMIVSGRTIGTVELLSRSGGSLVDRQMALAQTMANEAGIMLENSRLYAEVRHQALHDSLTGLPNRVLLVDRLEHALVQRPGSETQCAAMLFVDIDDFKVINDSFGHEVGDQVLTAVAARLQRLVRAGDTVARLSGDEFGIVLEGLQNRADADAAAARVVATFDRPLDLGTRQVRVTVSVGVDVGMSSDESAEDLIRNADFAMYSAKQSGKARHRIYEAAERQAADAGARLRSEILQAVERDELRVYYQPIVDLRTGAVRSLEALVRWEHPERGLLGPAEFIPIAEQMGTIVEIGTWVLQTACTDLRSWQRSDPGLAVAVNLSGRQLQDARLVERVRQVLHRTTIDPVSLILEVTETVLVAESSAEATLLRLKGLGVRLAIDDFGTGYSSISYLRRFPVDILKIDMEFTREVETAAGQALFGGIVQLGRSLGLEMTAEGIERAAQADRVVAAGCDRGQGFLFARPAPAKAVREALGQRSGPWRIDLAALPGRTAPPRPRPASTARRPAVVQSTRGT